MYSEIHQLKQIGLNKAQAARKLDINVKTVNKYWSATPDEFHTMQQAGKNRSKKLKHYRDVILTWLRAHPDMSCAQILDWLKEHYDDFSVRERTLRRYVDELRQKHNLPKPALSRQYQAVAELPPGLQLQVDFGQKRVRNTNGGYTTLYAMGTVLAHSRYKYGKWTDRPFTTATFVQMLLACFEYLGGVPAELVLDQDKLVAVSENYGDVIFTYEFEQFKQTMGFSVYLCRRSDPESKGKIEAVIKYMKRNFAANRLYTDITSWKQSFWDWLKRTGNNNVHGTTKKIPVEVFLEEQRYLRPLTTMDIATEIVTRTVRKDNTVFYKGNRYSVPLGTYRPDLQLRLEDTGNQIRLYDPTASELVAEHKISLQQGKLIQNNNHLRDKRDKIDELFERTLSTLGDSDEAKALLEGIRREKPRYVRDQFMLLNNLPGAYATPVISEAVKYCLERKLFSATDCLDAAAWFNQLQTDTADTFSTAEALIPEWFHVKAEKRDIAAAYAHLTGGECK